MNRRLGSGRLLSIIPLLLAVPGCGSDGAAGGGDPGGQVTDPWRRFCTGKFTADTPITDSFGDPEFTARAGDEYLLADYGNSGGKLRGEFVYLTAAGPDTFDVSADGAGAVPFTSNCAADSGVAYYAAFTDVSVYAEAALTAKVCDLAATTALPASTSDPRGYSAAGSSITLSGPQTYEVQLNAFSAQCGGNASGFVGVPETVLFGSHTWLVPIIGIIGPN